MKPILFNTEMVQAILSGRKTVTRRHLEDLPNDFDFLGWDMSSGNRKSYETVFYKGGNQQKRVNSKYIIGDILYVRESFGLQTRHGGEFLIYRADEINAMNYDVGATGSFKAVKVKWKPNIHMPKEKARLFLRVTNVKVERLRDIRYYEVYKEGIPSAPNCEQCPYSGNCINSSLICRHLKAFGKLWDSIIKKEKMDTCGWYANPYVFVYEFEVIERSELPLLDV